MFPVVHSHVTTNQVFKAYGELLWLNAHRPQDVCIRIAYGVSLKVWNAKYLLRMS